MNIEEARSITLELMVKHGLIEKGWTFVFDSARRRFGSTNSTEKIITLSRFLVILNTIEVVTDTILHEIAHVISPDRGHGFDWKRVCARVGCSSDRCYGKEVVIPKLRYEAFCPICGRKFQKARRVVRDRYCGVCYKTHKNGARLIFRRVL